MAELRLFLALWPELAIRQAMAARTRQLHALTGGRPTPPAQLHLTLTFLGSQPAARLAALQDGLAGLAPGPIRLQLDRYGFWSPGIVWLGCRTPAPALLDLVAALRQQLGQLGVACDDKPFRPHITLLRAARCPAAWPDCTALDWQARDIGLIASQTTPQGVIYRPLAWF